MSVRPQFYLLPPHTLPPSRPACQSNLTQWSVKIANWNKYAKDFDQKRAKRPPSNWFLYQEIFANMQIWKINGENRTQLTSQIPGILRIITARTFTLFNSIVILWSFHRFVWCARGTGRVSAKRFAAIEKILQNANHPIYDNCQSAGDPTLGYLSHPILAHLVQRYSDIFGRWKGREHRRLAQRRPLASEVSARSTRRRSSCSCSIRGQHAMVEGLQQMRMEVVQELGAIVAD